MVTEGTGGLLPFLLLLGDHIRGRHLVGEGDDDGVDVGPVQGVHQTLGAASDIEGTGVGGGEGVVRLRRDLDRWRAAGASGLTDEDDPGGLRAVRVRPFCRAEVHVDNSWHRSVAAEGHAVPVGLPVGWSVRVCFSRLAWFRTLALSWTAGGVDACRWGST
eukprot:TRINITY_DN11786_c0_g1_i1.p1 TRINITY_DN11786_c0_g1~~TRINITY_DN11786_c0_g1_i1.p1  ORF type:complete len:161 (+),score=10.93 TRINITY_DN11786_c0_g1_i1:149-631(+)